MWLLIFAAFFSADLGSKRQKGNTKTDIVLPSASSRDSGGSTCFLKSLRSGDKGWVIHGDLNYNKRICLSKSV